uniref:Uncharacterized protein n=1 Tax=Anguilla anguilla TaxID=7936 RepID=A0A0E9TYX0_ANGAN
MTHWVEWCHVPVSNSFDNSSGFYPDTFWLHPSQLENFHFSTKCSQVSLTSHRKNVHWG